ncbi:DUF3093 family protein [Streptomyces sp. NPDC046909]|uniref:DUF3093 family protein n=1 Tax=Streptomyces sp. NPDC046909 TaxID=3155617 RepID=UPI0033EE5C58
MHYTEKTPKTWSAICIALYLLGIGYMGIDTLPDEFGLWLGLSALFLLLLLPCLAVPISKFIYHRIQIDAQTLRVGRERIPLATIDPASVQAAAAEATTAAQRYAASLNTIDAPVPGLRATDRGAPRLVGGGWGAPMGMDTVVIRTWQGEQLTIATRDRTAFLTALAQATSVPHPSR